MCTPAVYSRVLKLLNPREIGPHSRNTMSSSGPITTLAMVANTSEATLAKVRFYSLSSMERRLTLEL